MGKGLKVTLRIVTAQAVMSLLAVVAVHSLLSPEVAMSVFVGAGIGILGTLILGLRMFYPERIRAADEVLQLFLRAEIQKFLVTVMLLVLVIKWLAVQPLPLFTGFFLTIVVNWAMLPFIKN